MHRIYTRLCAAVVVGALLALGLLSCSPSEGGEAKKGIQVFYSGNMMNYLEPCG
jgi:hypothetical protein